MAEEGNPTSDRPLGSSDFVLSAPEELHKRRIVWLWNGVDSTISALICQKLLELDTRAKRTIHLVLNTPGGNENDQWAIVDMMRWIGSPVYTYAIGEVCSAGTTILAAGEKRFVFPSTLLMVHLGSEDFDAKDERERKTKVARWEMQKKIYYEFLSNVTKQPIVKLQKLLEDGKDVWMCADEAVTFGLADQVLTGKRPGYLVRRKRRK